MRKTLFLIGLISLSAVVMADTPLTGEQLKKLISGNSVMLHSNARGVDFQLYLAADGSGVIHNEKNRRTFKGTWRITDTGEFCAKWGDNAEACGPVMDAGDGTYKRLEEGYPRAIWKKIHPGNFFQL